MGLDTKTNRLTDCQLQIDSDSGRTVGGVNTEAQEVKAL
jgi:hypothetical protein